MTSPAIVYVVDDEEPILRAFEMLLRGRRLEIRTFSSAGLFLRSYSSDWRGCLFVDLRMPDMDGSELYSELKRRNSELTVALMTGHGTADSLKQVLGEDFKLLEKPFSAATLLNVLADFGTRLDPTAE